MLCPCMAGGVWSCEQSSYTSSACQVHVFVRSNDISSQGRFVVTSDTLETWRRASEIDVVDYAALRFHHRSPCLGLGSLRLEPSRLEELLHTAGFNIDIQLELYAVVKGYYIK